MKKISALFVETNGVYFRPDVDAWDIKRDARKYKGPHSVVAHPPCKRWGSYWFGGPSAKVRKYKGDDGGCFAHALWAVRTFGGVIEHPAHSKAWPWFGLEKPDIDGGWTNRDIYGGRCCHVEQGNYGHPARKATWLYAVADDYPELIWGPCKKPKRTLDRKKVNGEKIYTPARLTKKENLQTPKEFADLLLSIAIGSK